MSSINGNGAWRRQRSHRLVRPFRVGSNGWRTSGRAHRTKRRAWPTGQHAPSKTANSSSRFAVRRLRSGRQPVVVPSAITTPIRRTTPSGAVFPDGSDRAAGERARAAAVERGLGWARGLCELLNRFGITALRLSLPYHDARMPPELAPGGLHRERERRPHRTGLPAGGARCAPGDRLAGTGGVRVDWHPRDQPRVLPVHATPRTNLSCAPLP